MARWILKAAIQKSISMLPEGHKVNYLFQKYVTKMRLDDAMMDQALVHCSDHVSHLLGRFSDIGAVDSLELGTGWYGVVPIGMFLCGVRNVTTVDITPLLRAENTKIAIDKFVEYDARGRLEAALPNLDPARLAVLKNLAARANGMPVREMLEALNVTYLVADARSLELPAESVNFIHSNDTFEHIYPDVLYDILLEFKRVGTGDALMSHFIDMSDHFFHFDKSISIYNFLRYTDGQWKVIDNSVAPQSRLRLPEYRALYERAGVAIVEEKPRPGNVAELAALPLAARFKAMSPADAAVTHAYIVSGAKR